MGRRRQYASATERKRAQRARERASAAHRLDAPARAVAAIADHGDPVGALATWAREKLIVPPGHWRSGQPMFLPDYAERWMRETWEAREAALSTPRKLAKSAICAIEALGFLCGPLRRPGWRAAIASLDKQKAGELRKQVAEISEASNLDIRIRRSPYPGVIESATGSLDTLSADRTAGHGAGYDRVYLDEVGLFPERARDLLAGLRSSVSARDGRIRHISIRGDSPLFAEILANPAIPSHVYAADEDCDIGDERQWYKANPGLGLIKSLQYMRDECERIQAGASSDEPSFRALDLNLELSPTREMVCTPGDLKACFVEEIEYRGPCYVGIDIGEASGGTAACAFWPRTGALRTWLAFGEVPKLKARAKRDGSDYPAMQRRGELRIYPGRTVPVKAFVADVRADLAGVTVRSCVADSYKCEELRGALGAWPLTIRRSGTGPDGSQAVRAFQRLVLDGGMRLAHNLSLASAIKESTLRRDSNGNPAIDRARSHGRIDVLSAAVLAVGAGSAHRPARGGLIRSMICEATG